MKKRTHAHTNTHVLIHTYNVHLIETRRFTILKLWEKRKSRSFKTVNYHEAHCRGRRARNTSVTHIKYINDKSFLKSSFGGIFSSSRMNTFCSQLIYTQNTFLKSTLISSVRYNILSPKTHDIFEPIENKIFTHNYNCIFPLSRILLKE